MAVVFFDGFDHYALHQTSISTSSSESLPNQLAAKGWNNGNAISNWEIHEVFARGSGNGIANKNNGAFIYYPVPSAATYTIGFNYQGVSSVVSQLLLRFAKTTIAQDHIRLVLRKKKTFASDLSQPTHAEFKIVAESRVGLIKDISSTIARSHIRILSFHTEAVKDKQIHIDKIDIQSTDKKKIEKIASSAAWSLGR